jgi:hypothetical protein
MRISENKPHRITTQLDYELTQLKREFDWILFKEKQKKIEQQWMLKKAYQKQKQPKPPKK